MDKIKQTPVEWLEQQINARGPIGEDTPTWLKELYEQAKAMDKENMIELIRFMRTNDKMGKSLEDLYQEFQYKKNL